MKKLWAKKYNYALNIGYIKCGGFHGKSEEKIKKL